MHSVLMIYVAIIAIHRIITLLNLPSQFCCKIINCNKYAQRAYDLCCDYCDTQNYYSIKLVSSFVKLFTATISMYSVLMIYVVIIAIQRIITLST